MQHKRSLNDLATKAKTLIAIWRLPFEFKTLNHQVIRLLKPKRGSQHEDKHLNATQ